MSFERFFILDEHICDKYNEFKPVYVETNTESEEILRNMNELHSEIKKWENITEEDQERIEELERNDKEVDEIIDALIYSSQEMIEWAEEKGLKYTKHYNTVSVKTLEIVKDAISRRR